MMAALGLLLSPAHGETGTVGLAPAGAFPTLVPADDALLTVEAVNGAPFARPSPDRVSAAALRAQILLDRAGFSPGAIDARDNDNFRRALAAFQRELGFPQSGMLDRVTWEALLAISVEPVLGEYEITRADIRGPFTPDLPAGIEERIGLRRLAYRDPRELLAEKFHMDQRLLSALNPGAAFDRAGTRIVVARVGRPGPKTKLRVARIEVDKPQRRLRAYDRDNRLVAVYPASVGSAEKPTPSGSFVVRRIARYPVWRYNPRFAFKDIKSTRPFRIAAGPNNPLGTVWIGISKPTYGIHGTPIPEQVGTASSNGCVRLTNWDAQALAAMVTRRTRVEVFE